MGQALHGKVIVITGASAGIGAATALALAPRGVKLVLGARRADKLAAVAERVRQAGSAVLALPCDVARREQVAALVAAAVQNFGRLDIMMANAGYGFLARIHEVTEEDFDDIVAVNVKGSLFAMQEAAAVMLPRHAGHIVVISSAAARRGLPLYGVYSMTKAAQLSLVEAMRVELRGTGVYVSTVHPITTATEFFEIASQRSAIQSSGLGRPQSVESVARKIVRLMEHPRPELWPHRLSRWGLGISAMLPRLTDRAMAAMLPRRTADAARSPKSVSGDSGESPPSPPSS